GADGGVPRPAEIQRSPLTANPFCPRNTPSRSFLAGGAIFFPASIIDPLSKTVAHAISAYLMKSASKLRLYNTLEQRLEDFSPIQPGKVGLYVCGPTVYDVPHAGHARSAIAFDVLVRHLRARGLEVTFVRNITDIDDKILARARQNGEEPLQLSARMTQVYSDDMGALHCLLPTHQPKVSDHLQEIIETVSTLIEQGAAYEVELPHGGRDVYFSVRAFEGYGKLSRRKLEDLEAGARVEKNDLKRDPMDFALWKAATEDGYGWPSPWGKGRPGWHIECSAMSTKYLGFGFDIHGGGMDLIFPHHENEIAQSEAAHPHQGPFARVWLHNGFVNVDKEKMSKSLGNFVTVRDVFDRNDPEGFRYFLLTVQYRGPLTFDSEKLDDGRVIFPGVDEAERRMDYLYSTCHRLRTLAEGAEPSAAKEPADLAAIRKVMTSARDKVSAALDDDLNTPVALAVLAEIAKYSNDLCDLAIKRRKDASWVVCARQLARQALEVLDACTQVLGLLRTPHEQYVERTRERRLRLRNLSQAQVEAKISERAQARKNKDFERADALRAQLEDWGIEMADGVEGTTWKVLV
ncbi:MAG TPA: cysteine--tRNA ligase, partial [Polyangiaceae bacterium]|nr:cysteine--tRNA ligase [Polyangiaceae bacterium]